MNIIFELSPAETLLLRDSGAAKLKDLLKFTFLDLLLKKIIRLEKVQRKSHPRDKYIGTYTYVVVGDNFTKIDIEKHETILLSPFYKSRNIRILFHHFVKMVYENSKGTNNYQRLIRNSPSLSLFFKNNFFVKFFNMTVHNQKGIEMKEKLLQELAVLERKMSDFLNNNLDDSAKILMVAKGNIFLIKNFDFKLFKEIDEELLKHQKVMHRNQFDDYGDWWIYTDLWDDLKTFNDLDHTFDSFDSALDTSSYDSGCSSCSGCGGCGGCS